MALWDPEPEPRQAIPSPLPNPELTPSTNPILGRNLGRWAHVYFTSPPEQRETAVAELLHELQKQPAGNASLVSPKPRAKEVTLPPEILCPRCLQKNVVTMECCLFCGAPLHSGIAPGDAGAHMQSAVLNQPTPPSGSALDYDSQLELLRSFSLGSEPAPRNGISRRMQFALAGCLIVIGAAFYLLWAQHSAVSHGQSLPSAVARRSDSSFVESARATPSIQAGANALQSPPTADSVDAGQQPGATARSAPRIVSASDSAVIGPAGSAADTADGTQELRLAQRYLASSHGPRDPTDAAKMLWKAVAKQNANATLLLADLYLKGDGVPQSCEQARLLLAAAAQRHLHGAAERLHNLDSSSCP